MKYASCKKCGITIPKDMHDICAYCPTDSEDLNYWDDKKDDSNELNLLKKIVRSQFEIFELIQYRIDEIVKEDTCGTWAGNKEMFACLMDIQSMIK